MIEVREALRQAVRTLRNEGVDSPRLDAELLLAHVLKANRASILAWPDRTLTPKELTAFRDLVSSRAARRPLSYLTGQREFFGLDFAVDARVLIPRPETELVVEQALALVRRMPEALLIADVGTGSGALGVTLAVHLPKAIVYALDQSAGALEVTAENARRHHVAVRVRCLAGDLLEPLPEAVHLITANLPYVASGEWESLAPEIRDHEPRDALDGGADGLEQIRRLIATAEPNLLPGGAVLIEIGAGHGSQAITLAKEQFATARVALVQDYAGLDRLVVIETAADR